MAVPAYDAIKLVRRLVDEYGYEERQAYGLVSTTREMIAGATKAVADKDFFESQFKTLRKHLDAKTGAMSKDTVDQKSNIAKIRSDFAEMRTDIAVIKADIAEIRADIKAMPSRVFFAFIATSTLVHVLEWLVERLV